MTGLELEALEAFIRAIAAEEAGRVVHQPVSARTVEDARERLRDAIYEANQP